MIYQRLTTTAFIAVPPTGSQLTVPSHYVEVGDNVRVTCTVDRVKPPLSDIYLEYGGFIIQSINNSLLEEETEETGVYMQSQTFTVAVLQHNNLICYGIKSYPNYTQYVLGESYLEIGCESNS